MSSVETPPRRWTVLELINWTTSYFQEKGIENSRLNVELLLAHVLGCKRVDLYLDFDRPLVPEELQNFKSLIKRRVAREPLQYVIGETEFMGLPFIVGPGALVPRPETETLVELVLQQLEELPEAVNVLDVGTGTGCIALSIAKLAPNARVTAVDCSPEALQYARNNAEQLELSDKVTLLQQDALQNWPESLHHTFDFIVSNPPYIAESEYETLMPEIRQYEPKIALLAGQEGLDFYLLFLEIAKQLLNDKGRLFFEIGEKQADAICKQYMNKGYRDAVVHHDLAGKDRIIELTI